METSHLSALLGELRDQLVDDARLVGSVGRRQQRRQLLARLQAILDVGADNIAPADSVATAQQDWAHDMRVRIDDEAPWRVDRSGLRTAVRKSTTVAAG